MVVVTHPESHTTPCLPSSLQDPGWTLHVPYIGPHQIVLCLRDAKDREDGGLNGSRAPGVRSFSTSMSRSRCSVMLGFAL